MHLDLTLFFSSTPVCMKLCNCCVECLFVLVLHCTCLSLYFATTTHTHMYTLSHIHTQAHTYTHQENVSSAPGTAHCRRSRKWCHSPRCEGHHHRNHTDCTLGVPTQTQRTLRIHMYNVLCLCMQTCTPVWMCKKERGESECTSVHTCMCANINPNQWLSHWLFAMTVSIW